MSSVEYQEARGLLGGAVAAKAATLAPVERLRLFTLQAMSMRPGGLRAVAEEMLDRFPERVTNTASELDAEWGNKHSPRGMALGEIERYLMELAIAPEVYAYVQHFKDVNGALDLMIAERQKRAVASIVHTGISRQVFRTLDRGLRARKIVVVQGVEGVGKSYSAEAWCNQHLGDARFVRLEGIVNRTTFFQAVSKALGLAASVAQKSHEMQIRIRQHLERSGIMLVIDEAHRLFPQAQRIYSHPELLNWIYTLWDFNIPVALLVTPQFVSRMDAVEDQTDWRSGQFKRRVEMWTPLVEKLNEAELRAVTRSVAPSFKDVMIDELVDFAIGSRRQMDAAKRAISAATYIAEENGRTAPTFADLRAGIQEASSTEEAMVTNLDRERLKRSRKAVATPLRGQSLTGIEARLSTQTRVAPEELSAPAGVD